MWGFAKSTIDRISRVSYAAGMVSIVAMMVLITLDVVSKYLFNFPLPWTQEITSAYFMVALIFLPMAYITGSEGQINLELFSDLFGRRVKRAAGYFALLVTMVYMALFAYSTILEALAATEIAEGWTSGRGDIPVWPSRWMLPVGCVLTIAVLIQVLRRPGQQSGSGETLS